MWPLIIQSQFAKNTWIFSLTLDLPYVFKHKFSLCVLYAASRPETMLSNNFTKIGNQRILKTISNMNIIFACFTVCGGEITGQSRGNIHSPRFPSEYPLDINCTWVITVPEGKYMRLVFPILRTEENHDLIVLKTDDYLDE